MWHRMVNVAQNEETGRLEKAINHSSGAQEYNMLSLSWLTTGALGPDLSSALSKIQLRGPLSWSVSLIICGGGAPQSHLRPKWKQSAPSVSLKAHLCSRLDPHTDTYRGFHVGFFCIYLFSIFAYFVTEQPIGQGRQPRDKKMLSDIDILLTKLK